MMNFKFVKIGGRTFIAEFNAKWKPIRIKERKIYEKGRPWEYIYDVSYWSAKHHKLGSTKTLPFRIIKKALEQNA
jgi:hypothetical protein